MRSTTARALRSLLRTARNRLHVGADRLLQSDPRRSTVVKPVIASYGGLGNRAQLVDPGGTVVNETYDAIDPRKLVTDGSTTIAESMYAGASPAPGS
jgi:hypothetical protein